MTTTPISDAIYYNDKAQGWIKALDSARSHYLNDFKLEYAELYLVMETINRVDAELLLMGEALEKIAAKKPLWKRILRIK